MKNLSRLLLTASLTSAVLCAQTDSPESRGPRRGPGGHGRGPGFPVVRVLDADQDGVISAAEIAGASAALKTLDANADGAVSAEELHPARPANAPTPPADAPRRGARDGQRPAMPVMLALDADTDGALSAAEIANAARSLAALDANKDGRLTHDELRPLPPE